MNACETLPKPPKLQSHNGAYIFGRKRLSYSEGTTVKPDAPKCQRCTTSTFITIYILTAT